jgi:heat shock protein HslJ
MSIKKIGTLAGVVLAVVFLSGCGQKKDTSVVPSQTNPAANQSSSTSSEQNGSEVSSETPPAPTGKVDDTVNAIIDGANKESAQVTSDDNDAKSAAASDSEAVGETGAGL